MTETDDHVCCFATCGKPWHAYIERSGGQGRRYVCEGHTPGLCVGCRIRPAMFGVGVIPVFCYVCDGGGEETITYRGEDEAPVCGGVTHAQLTDKGVGEPGVGEGFEPGVISGPANPKDGGGAAIWPLGPIEDGMRHWFEYTHLPPHLQVTSKPFHQLATFISSTIKPGRERAVTLRKLLEAKDAAVRATLRPGA